MTTPPERKVSQLVHVPGNPKANLDTCRDEEFFGCDVEIVDTDVINARRFVRDHRNDVRWTQERGWFLYDDTRWVNENGRVMQLAMETALSIYDELKNEAGDNRRVNELFKWAKRSQSAERLRAMLSLAQSDPAITTKLSAFDVDPMLLNCENGTIDLRTGQLREHRREDLCSRVTPVIYDPDAKCSQFFAFLDRIMNKNDDLIEYIRRVLGYSLTGLTGEQIFLFLWGLGANGKSVLLNIVSTLLGEYACNTPTETLMLRQRGAIPNDLARLAGVRLVTANETSEGQRLDEAKIKDLTGGDTISARFLHREYFDYKPQFKVWMRGNHKPAINGTDDGIWRRIHLVPFAVRIPEDERDKQLEDKLKKELSGILVWAVQGCLKWQSEGLRAPQVVSDATSAYREEMDIVGAFLEECCLPDESVSVSAKSLYAAYKTWCTDNGNYPLSQRRFGMSLSERSFQRDRKSEGVQYLGLQVKDMNDYEPGFNKSTLGASRVGENLQQGSPSYIHSRGFNT